MTTTPSEPNPDSHARLPAFASVRPRENFPVLSAVVSKPLRPGFAAVYSFCRVSDDIADDPIREPAERLEMLRRWRGELDAAFLGRPRLPIMSALARAAERYDLPAAPFHRLLDAFEQDQSTTEYETWDEIVRYAQLSANPVGELVLRIGGHVPADQGWAELVRLSDATCTALQFVNFWQDVRRDLLELNRLYIPFESSGMRPDAWRQLAHERQSSTGVARFRSIIEPLLDRTDAMMRSAAELPAVVTSELVKPISLFQQAGLHVAQRIRSTGFATLWRRPAVSRLRLVCMTAAILLRPARAAG
ncbi:MAG: squalene/phytoene synthase family protein, partial [Planctomycetota bacterium]